MPTLHITVPGQPDISGSCPLPVVSGTLYTCPLGAFAMTPTPQGGFQSTGQGPTYDLHGLIQISTASVGYGTVIFAGNYVVKGKGASGTVSWDGTTPPSDKDSDPWTSEVTTPEPHPPSR